MDALADVVARQRRAGISEPTALYKATREAMDAMIFDERIPCDAQRGTPNPFAAGKMRDRMRGNLYPFLPLTDPQMVAAFERELEERAKLYNASRRPVGLFWMPEFAKLIVRQRGAVLGVDQRGAGAEPPRMRAVVEAAAAAARAGGAHDGALGSTSSGLTGNDGKSLRKRIEELMRLDERSVERLYARAADACARNGARLARLMLHVANEVPDVAEFCEALPSTAATSGAAAVGGQPGACPAEGDTASGDTELSSCGTAATSTASPSLLGTPPSPSTAPKPSHADSASSQPTAAPVHANVAHELEVVTEDVTEDVTEVVTEVVTEAVTEVVTEVVTEAGAESKPDYARMAADVALSLQTRTHAAELAAAAERHREREAALSAQHAHELTKLTERVAELETRLLTWQLTCAVLLALTTALLFGMGHVILASALSLARMAALTASVGTLLTAAAYVVVSALCFAGSAPACALEAALLEAVRWAWWALSWAWQLLSVALGALSGGARLGALALALLFGRSVRRARRAQRDKDAGMQAALSAVLSAQALEDTAWRVTEAQLHAQLSVALRELREIDEAVRAVPRAPCRALTELREIEEAVGAVPSAPCRAPTELREIEEAVRAVPSAPCRALTELREIEEAEAVGARHGAQPVAAAAALGGAAGAATRAAAASESGAAAVLSPPRGFMARRFARIDQAKRDRADDQADDQADDEDDAAPTTPTARLESGGTAAA